MAVDWDHARQPGTHEQTPQGCRPIFRVIAGGNCPGMKSMLADFSQEKGKREIWSYLFARVPSPFLPLLTILVASRFVTPPALSLSLSRTEHCHRSNGDSEITTLSYRYARTTIIGARSYCIATDDPSKFMHLENCIRLIEKFCWQTSNRVVCRSVIDQLHTWAEHLVSEDSNIGYFEAKIEYFSSRFYYHFICWLKCIFLIYK